MRAASVTVIGIALVCASPVSFAQSAADADIAALRAQVESLMARLDALERSQGGSAQVVDQPIEPVAQQPSSWASTVRVRGDVRYRHESITGDGIRDRHRQRIRARLGAIAQPADNVEVGFGLTTGGANPISGNQTLGGGFSRKDITLDYAYFDWRLSDTLTLRGGKIRNPFFRPANHHLINDSDLNPEGLAMSYSSGGFFANLGGFFVEERSSSDNTLLFAAQAGFRRDLSGGARLTAGASYYGYDEVRGREPFFFEHGNLLDASGRYVNDFTEVELFGQLDFELAGQPMRVFMDYVTNRDADQFNDGYAFGIFYRDASGPGNWDIGYTYQDLEADAVIGTFSDSDWAGGGSDAKGHTFLASYVLNGGWNLGLRYIVNDRDLASGRPRDYNRLIADISFGF
ncbi:MAG TPA: putative porin [Gammaproteobacteria bacterium]